MFDAGEFSGASYMVMPLLQGETLAERLRRGPLPPGRAVALAIEIAGALNAAHRAGIVHRDIKPSNIMITGSGAKLLDFGPARAEEPGPLAGEVHTLPTRSAPLTIVVGTLQYMALEQIEGKPLDRRADIFSLGAVLYETISGRRAFSSRRISSRNWFTPLRSTTKG